MPEVTYRGNLSASTFPLVSNYQGRSIIVPSIDQSYIRGLQVPQDGLVNENDRGIPQIQYAHNVMPSGEGFQTVGFIKRNTNAIPGGAIPDTMIPIRDNGGFGTYYSPTPMLAFCNNVAACYMYTADPLAPNPSWIAIPVIGVNDVYSGAKTSASLNGDTFVFCAGSLTPLRQILPFNPSINTVAFIGITIINIRGITSSYGYLIAFSDTAVAWSSLLNPLDFTPSLVTGASSISIQEAKGKIKLCVPHEMGYLILCEDNVVSATYTGNPRQPWLFKEVSDAGGYLPTSQFFLQNFITSDTTANQYYMYGKNGLQNIGSRAAVNTLPDVNDFMSGNVFEDFDVFTRLFTITNLSLSKLVCSLTYVANRYLVISYGIPPGVGVSVSFTHALIYDTLNKRLGKIRFTHIIVFEAPSVVTTNTVGIDNPTPRDRIHFVQTSGDVYSLNFDSLAITNLDAVMMLGKFQLQRNDIFQLEDIQLENVQAGALCDAFVYTSLDGKNSLVAAGVPATIKTTAANLRRWAYHASGINHTIAFTGAFYASSIQIKGHNNGKR